ncbi:MAG: hypothetical protein QOF58_1473 [Pseudonocardiales bacterium]|nr:hypothetical protein [Pseudonocardiales bacterium]
MTPGPAAFLAAGPVAAGTIPVPMAGQASVELPGRAREIEILRKALAGDTRCVAITGEPGIGKSRLLAELGKLADAAGWAVRGARAAEFESHVPFGCSSRRSMPSWDAPSWGNSSSDCSRPSSRRSPPPAPPTWSTRSGIGCIGRYGRRWSWSQGRPGWCSCSTTCTGRTRVGGAARLPPAPPAAGAAAPGAGRPSTADVTTAVARAVPCRGGAAGAHGVEPRAPNGSCRRSSVVPGGRRSSLPARETRSTWKPWCGPRRAPCRRCTPTGRSR